MSTVIKTLFFLPSLLAAPFVMAYCYPPAPSMKEILRNPVHWPMFILFGSMFLVGWPFMWVCLKLE